MHTGPIKWIGGEHDFALDIGALRALQDACNAGPEEIRSRIIAGTWRVNDLFDTIRLGLVGAGAMKDADARRFVTQLWEQHPAVQFRFVAAQVLAAALFGVEDDPVGEPTGATAAPPENGSSPASTATAP